jgi:hypothetical protein
MRKQNVTVTNDPILWDAEIARIKARILERQPHPTQENINQAITFYTEAVDSGFTTYLSAISQNNHPLQLGALSAYATALGERARLRPPENKDLALLEMSTASGLIWTIYPEVKNFDRTETVLGRVLTYCWENQIPENHPTLRQALFLYLKLARETEDKTRFKARLEQVEKMKFPPSLKILEALRSTTGA